MQELVGTTFAVGDGQYRVVDVRQLRGEVMVYAEEILTKGGESPRRKPRRAAFHYADIANLLDKNIA